MPDARDDQPTLGELGRRLDHYALTTGAALDKLEAKLDAMGDTYVTRREYDRDDADHEQAHRDFRAEIADIKKAAVDSRRWAIGTALTVAALVLTTLGLLLNYTG